jgi:hypothetical protein
VAVSRFGEHLDYLLLFRGGRWIAPGFKLKHRLEDRPRAGSVMMLDEMLSAAIAPAVALL